MMSSSTKQPNSNGNPNRNFVRRDSHSILQGGWVPPTNSERMDGSTSSGFCPLDTEIQSKYANFPLVRDMLLSEDTRTAALEADGAKQMSYTKSNDGWFKTLFVFEGRAFGRYNWILFVVTLNAVVWTVVAELFIPEPNDDEVEAYENFFALILSTTLAFLLVFRLNRSNERFWQARKAWGSMLALGRSLTSGAIIHGSYDPTNRDDVVRWTAAFVLATMFFIRGERRMIVDAFAGILTKDQVKKLKRATHPPIHAGDLCRWHLHQLFSVSDNTNFSLAQARIQQLSTLEHQLNELQDDLGALERIKATPLPLVYVTHLRTWLVLFLFSMPFIWQPSLGWATIPVVFLTSFAMLGLEGAAVEMESPWTHRTNHLCMDAYCLLLLSNIQQQIQEDADRRIDAAPSDFLRSWRKGIEQPPTSPMSPSAKLEMSDTSLSLSSFHNPLKNGLHNSTKLETIEGHLGDSYASIDTIDC